MNRTAVAAIADASNNYTACLDNQNRMLDGAKKEQCWEFVVWWGEEVDGKQFGEASGKRRKARPWRIHITAIRR